MKWRETEHAPTSRRERIPFRSGNVEFLKHWSFCHHHFQSVSGEHCHIQMLDGGIPNLRSCRQVATCWCLSLAHQRHENRRKPGIGSGNPPHQSYLKGWLVCFFHYYQISIVIHYISIASGNPLYSIILHVFFRCVILQLVIPLVMACRTSSGIRHDCVFHQLVNTCWKQLQGTCFSTCARPNNIVS